MPESTQAQRLADEETGDDRSPAEPVRDKPEQTPSLSHEKSNLRDQSKQGGKGQKRRTLDEFMREFPSGERIGTD